MNLVFTHGIPPDFSGGVHIFIPPYAIGPVSSLLSRAMRTNDVHCRESAGTKPGVVVLEVVPVTGAAFAGHHEPFHVRLSFPTRPL